MGADAEARPVPQCIGGPIDGQSAVGGEPGKDCFVIQRKWLGGVVLHRYMWDGFDWIYSGWEVK